MTVALQRLSRAESDLVAQRRRGRNVAIMAALLALVALFYFIAIAKLSHPHHEAPVTPAAQAPP